MSALFHMMPEFPEAEGPTSVSSEPLNQALGAEVLYRNHEVLSRACQKSEISLPSNQFFDQLMSKLDGITQDSEYDDVETLSAYYDGQVELPEIDDYPHAQRFTQNLMLLSQACSALPSYLASEDFASRVLSALPATSSDNEQRLRNALQNLPIYQPHPNFAQQVLALLPASLEQAENEASLNAALRALPSPQASIDFVERVMAALPNHVDIQHHNQQSLKNALKALPQIEAPADFVAKVMLATEKMQRKKIFALPQLMQKRGAQWAAAIALFGFLALLSQQILSGTVLPGSEVASVPTDHIVQVEYQAEDLLFESQLDSSLDNSFENNYNQMIGG